MPDMQPLLIASGVLVVIVTIGSEAVKRLLDSSLERLMGEGAFETCMLILDKRVARMLFPTFKQYYLRFKLHEAMGETSAARAMLDHLLAMRAPGGRRLALVSIALDFFADTGDKKAAREALEEIERGGDPASIARCRDIYRIAFGGDPLGIERMEELLPSASPRMRCRIYRLLERAYAKRGDREAAGRYAAMLCDLKIELKRAERRS